MLQHEFEGADVFIVHLVPTHGYCVVLFQDAKRRKPRCVTMPGGQWDRTHLNLQEVASDELFEESSKSISVNSDIFKTMDDNDMYVDIRGINFKDKHANKKRRVYFCYMPVIDKEIYYANNKILFEATGRDAWKYKETNNIIFIPIKNIITSIFTILTRTDWMEETTINDVDNNPYSVQRITIDALYKFLRNKKILDFDSSLTAGGQKKGLSSLNSLTSWFRRAPQTSSVTMTTKTNVPPVSALSPRSPRSPRSQGTQKPQSSPRTQITHDGTQKNHRTRRHQRPQRPPMSFDTETIIREMLQNIYTFTESTTIKTIQYIK